MAIAPVPGDISNAFGQKRWRRKHNGVDYDADMGTYVKASAAGEVVRAYNHKPKEYFSINENDKVVKKFRGAYGKMIIISHGRDIDTHKYTYTLYSHLIDYMSMSKGKRVKKGQLIGFVGNTGTKQGFYKWKGGDHLHFEVIESLTELDWVKTGNLDQHFASEDKRIDPETFFRKGVFVDDINSKHKGVYTFDLGNGTTITDDGSKFIHSNSKGEVLNVFKKGESHFLNKGTEHELFEFLNSVADSRTTGELVAFIPTRTFLGKMIQFDVKLLLTVNRQLMKFPFNPPHKDGRIENCPRHRPIRKK
ncbi:MAG: M23 family metallopeptidase [Thermodesulfobacteriota bacterium]